MSDRPKRILFVDNEPLKIGAIVRTVGSLGYDVAVIDDLDEAREALTGQWWHLAVVDIRLVDEQNDKDFSGLDLVTQETDPVIPKLILTAYPSVEAAVEALKHYPGQLPPAVDFVAKLDPLDRIVDRIVTAVEGRARINWDLEVDFQAPLTFLGMADWLHRNPPPGGLPPQAVTDSAGELADLWGRLFPDQNRVTIFPSPQGRSDALVCRAKPYTDVDGSLVGARTIVVKSGWRDEIAQEDQSFETFVLPYAGAATTQKLVFAETLHFGAIVYSLVGERLEETESFAEFYRAEDAKAVIQAICHLFEHVCTPWYDSMPIRQSSMGLDEAYRWSMRLDSPGKRKRLAERLAELAANAGSLGFSAAGTGKKVRFEFAPDLALDVQTLHKWIYHTQEALESSVLEPFPESPTHGDPNGQNVLVDRNRQTWLIDFGSTDYGYRLRDFAELESVIAFDLPRHQNPGTLLWFEKTIFAQARWQDELNLPTDLEERLADEEQSKALRSIEQLRKLAMLWEEDGGTLQRYYLALFFEAVLRLMTDGRDSAAQLPSLSRRAHALLRAAVIIKTLSA